MTKVAQATAVGLIALCGSSAQAEPTGPQRFCELYGDSPGCAGTLVTCEQCHTSTDPPAWNEFGGALLGEIGDRPFDDAIVGALQALEQVDSDEDGVSNFEEIIIGTRPGDAESVWIEPERPRGEPNPDYLVGQYDVAFAYKRAMILYCGRSPTYDERNAIRAITDVQDQKEHLHEALDECLAGEYWRTTGLRELADKRVRPIAAVGPTTEVVFQSVRLVLGDYDWDYRLWRYVLTDDRDMRELLTAQYHVREDDEGNFEVVEGTIRNPNGLVAGGQPLQPEHRAGMLTTQWFLMANTMFSALPRTTAAQAYRAYLGADISRQQGIRPVAGEPIDIDNKGVTERVCADCHSTLDPLAYAFAYYTGIELPDIGTYDAARPAAMIPDWDPAAQRSTVFGEAVDDVVGWARLASQRTEFQRNMADMFFRHALGRGPAPDEAQPFRVIWQSIPGDGYSANQVIHRLVDTRAFGVP